VDAVEPSIRACAVQELAAPPYLRSEANAKPRLGANHGSAFYAMWALVTRDDGPLIALALAKNEDPSVLWYGIKAASGAIYRQRDIDPGLAEMLRLLATNPSQDAKVRATAIGAVSTSSSDKFTPWLLSTLADPALVVSAAAARTLLELDKPRFRAIVEPVAATWPPDSEAPYDATETRRLLEDDTETEDNPEAEDDPSDAEDSV
jgi:hypothetical protein